MADYMLAYHGGTMPETPEAGAAMMKRWTDWMAGLGSSLVTPGNPVGQSWTVTSEGASQGGGANPLTGWSIVHAESLDAALEMAKSCPHLHDGGTVEVAEVIVM